MKNTSNLYDIDGNLIRSIKDTEELSIEEAKTRLEQYMNKCKAIDKNDPKYSIYSEYIRNLNSYILRLYLQMPKDEILSSLQQTYGKDEVNNALEQLKQTIENDYSDNNEVKKDDKQPIMDEYIDFEEESKDDNNDVEQQRA